MSISGIASPGGYQPPAPVATPPAAAGIRKDDGDGDNDATEAKAAKPAPSGRRLDISV